MAFSAGNAGSSIFGAGADTTNMIPSETGPDLEEIETDAIGFQSIAGETRLRITPSWPMDAPPPPTASLLSVASHKGLLAAAGPASVIIAGTSSVRQAFSTSDSMDGNTKSFTPDLTLNIGMRVSQIAFSADENRLVISAENGGGLAVYSVQALMEGNTQPEFELSTNGVSLRSMLANPTPEKAELFAVVTTNGELMMANLNTRQFLNSTQGQSMKHGVSCISWSARGKQLIAGLGNGACSQMTPEGEVKAEIPRPDRLDGDQHVASISWLENNLFLVNHTLSSFDLDIPTPSTFHLITRLTQPPNSFRFQKLPDPCLPMSARRSPPYFFIHRLREFPPNLQDLIVIASTVSPDVGMLCRSKAPLTGALPAETITNVFTTTIMANDARRANLPMGDTTDTSPVGVALDLSSQEKVKRPLPGEEIEDSLSPLPGLMILNDEGVLSLWWLIYADSIRQNTIYPGLVHGGAQKQSQPLFASQSSNSAPSFGQASFGERAVVKNSGSAFSEPPKNAFGASSGLGKPQSLWGGSNSAISSSAAPTFGQPSFGSSPAGRGGSQGIAFGMAGGMGNNTSPWNSASGSGSNQNNSFSQSGGLGMQGGSQLGNTSSGNAFGSSNTGGFASFATAPGFAAAAAQSGGASVFSKAAPGASFGAGMDTDQGFGGTTKKDNEPSSGLFSGQGFTLGSTFKGDGTATNDLPKLDGKISNSLFGDNFSKTLDEKKTNAPTPRIQEAEMDDSMSEGDESSLGYPVSTESTNMAARPDLSKSQFPGTVPPLIGGLFGTQAQNSTTPAAVQDSMPATSSFETSKPITTTPKETPRKPLEHSRFPVETPASLQVKSEPEEEQLTLSIIPESAPEAPLPPESTSKARYAVGDSSNSSKSSAEDAPLPPDFLPPKNKLKDSQPLIDEAPLPPNDDGDDGLDDEEGSGVDVAQEISPITDPNQSPKITPESSLGASFEKSPLGGLFTQVSKQQPRQSTKNLFGEISSKSIPSFLPSSKVQESQRSPSPVRSLIKDKDISFRPDNARSLSAPGHPLKAVARRKPAPSLNNNEAFSKSLFEQRKQELELQAVKQAQILLEEEQELSDKEDEMVREELEREVEPTKILDPFLAHQDYVGNASKPGIPGQIETVYRDINSMIDTLGLNARSLKAFIKGHNELYQEGGRSRDDLEQGDWCLFEIDDLEIIESKLLEQLKEGRITGVQHKLETCQSLRKDLYKIRSKRHETTNVIQSRSEPRKTEAASTSHLTPEQYTIQQDLREEFLKVQKLIAEAEEGISTLGVLISSFDSNTNNGKPAPFKKPTVEAVTSTIYKMTSMVEKKALDIDILEAQIKRLRLSSPLRRPDSREASPSLPSALRNSTSARRKGRGKGGGFSPADGLKASVGGGGGNGTPRKRMDGVTSEEVERYKAKERHRREVNALIKKAFLEAGPKVQELS